MKYFDIYIRSWKENDPLEEKVAALLNFCMKIQSYVSKGTLLELD